VLERLGSGGMATVLLCEDERLGRPVAVKRMHADSPRDVEQRLLREAKLGASLNHPNLVSVFDIEADDEGVLIVMEYVEGEALARTLRAGPIASGRVAAIARGLGEALDHVHGQGVVHRDVKPGNVLLRSDGAVKLADLGIAMAADRTRLTVSGTVLGSAAYMAPEQLEGRDVGPAADVYALATVCFESLAGRRARPGRTPMEIAHQIATAGPPDVREHAPDLPAAAAAALARGMAREPADRQRSAGAFAAELARALEQREPPTAATRAIATPAPAPAVAARGSRAGAVLALVLLALAAAGVAGAVLLSGGGGGGDERAEQPAAAAPEPQDADAGKQPKAKKDKKDKRAKREEEQAAAPLDPARGSELNDQGFALMGQGDFAGAVPILQQAVASWPADSREIAYAYALFNLGQSLNRSDRPEEAIPYLEKRLTWDDQRDKVQAELDLALSKAGQG
jgi:serine/threonine-protein kinase